MTYINERQSPWTIKTNKLDKDNKISMIITMDVNAWTELEHVEKGGIKELQRSIIHAKNHLLKDKI